MKRKERNEVKRLVEMLGGQTTTAEIVGTSIPAVNRWVKKGALPWTEYTGRTQYAKKMAAALGGQISEQKILSLCKPRN